MVGQEVDKERYAGSCNPSRRAKRTPAASTSHMASDHDNVPKATPILPKGQPPLPADSPMDTSSAPSTASAAPAPAKRGRKPGPLSRAAREAQRRLNHSIIEKARRTKINEALATLRELVPLDYGQPKPTNPPESDEEGDGEYRPGSSKPKKQGKEEKKEKEFKLEILVRTVAYMKELISRVGDLEANPPQPQPQPSSSSPLCPNCAAPSTASRKRPREEGDMGAPSDRAVRRARRDSYISVAGETLSPIPSPLQAPFSSRPSSSRHPSLDGPLPPISSWLLDSESDSRILPHRDSHPKPPSSYLPSPPSSTQFDPVRPTHVPPSLNLDHPSSSASTSSLTSPTRTMEDESAATLLLHIAGGTSPAFRPTLEDSDSISALPITRRLSLSEVRTYSSSSVESSFCPLDTSRSEKSTNVRAERNRQVETPASLLGIRHLVRP
ncbi:hypothetical protein CC1G_06940 [Coprinopsis cinerea okayama7|uniref:BHLH domain-containing protein n=1 Tax=Coprinopsis cinerea (strain Okayama-7 / 130 / ATCC MYA-4618 / FGSC 9003) TaxID=240176 RepID=A8NZS0_COPC7|nr:hypothetical protein CC1G_06940 [Coprinopsis cinerea okayama7\|eukprot:XP_001837734.2 hypothetical protein CC1G_06940 [Coprinopsis cinerea okayama7\